MISTRQPKGIPAGGQFASTAHSEAPIALPPAVPDQLETAEEWLARGGLQAPLRKTARGFSYTSPGGRRVLLTGLGTNAAEVRLGTVIIGSGTHGASPETDVNSIRRISWGAAVADAARGASPIFQGGRYRPAARPPWISITDGHLTACQPVAGDYNSHFTYLRHDYSTGETTVVRDVMVARMADDAPSLDDVVLSMRPGADGASEGRDAFDLLLSRACADPDAHPDILAHLTRDPEAAAAATRFPQYRLAADTTDLEAEADKADHRMLFDPTSGRVQLRTGTATYSARAEIGPDGTISRYLNDEPVDSFPDGYRKSSSLDGWIRRRRDRLLEVAATSSPFSPLSPASGAAHASA